MSALNHTEVTESMSGVKKGPFIGYKIAIITRFVKSAVY